MKISAIQSFADRQKLPAALPQDSNTWKSMAHFGKTTNSLNVRERMMAYDVGKYIDKGWPFTNPAITFASGVYKKASSAGFLVDVTSIKS